jgi:hypothetical protein
MRNTLRDSVLRAGPVRVFDLVLAQRGATPLDRRGRVVQIREVIGDAECSTSPG